MTYDRKLCKSKAERNRNSRDKNLGEALRKPLTLSFKTSSETSLTTIAMRRASNRSKAKITLATTPWKDEE